MAHSVTETIVYLPVPALALDDELRVVAFNSLFSETFGGEPEPDGALSDYFAEELADGLAQAAERAGQLGFTVLISGERGYRIEVMKMDGHFLYFFFSVAEPDAACIIGSQAESLSRLRFDALAIPPDELRERSVAFAESVKAAFPPVLIDIALEKGRERYDLIDVMPELAKKLDARVKKNKGQFILEIPDHAEVFISEREQLRENLLRLVAFVAGRLKKGGAATLRCRELGSPRGFYKWMINLAEGPSENAVSDLEKFWESKGARRTPALSFYRCGARLSVYTLPNAGTVYSVAMHQPRED